MSARSSSRLLAATARTHENDPVAGLAGDLADLAATCDATTDALEHRDLPALVAANEQAERLTARIREHAAGLTDADRMSVDTDPARALRERINRAAQRNAYLIERAWALDAATMRLLASLGRPPLDLAVRPYSPPDGPGYLDRQA